MPSPDWNWTIEKQICSKAELAALLIRDIVAELERSGWSKKEQLDTHLCLEEAFMNAIKHGNDNDNTKCVNLKCWINGQIFRIQISDEGPDFRLEDIPDPTAEENLTNTSGRGLMLMRHYMDVVDYNDLGNLVTLEKHRKSDPS